MAEKESILIVDDDEGSCKTLNLIFNKKGYETETAGTGKEALEKLKKRFFNLILLDIRLPDIEGIELLIPIKKEHPSVDVIMMTAYASIELAVRALNEGAFAFVTKPLNMDEVLSIIKNVFEKQRLITEKRQAEQKLKESELKFRVLFEEALNPILIVDENGMYVDANEAACKFLESEKEEILGKAVWNYTPPHLLQEQKKTHAPFFNRRTLETEYLVKGKIKTLLLNVVPIDIMGKKLLYGIGQDITERKNAEEKLEKSEIKYHEAYERAEFYKNLFAHDISNILQNIQTSTGLISLWQKDTEKIEKIVNLIETINDQVIRGASLISNVRKLSQLNKFTETLRRIEVIQTLKKAIEFIHQSYVFKEIIIQIDPPFNESYVFANEFLLDIFENILFNAVKHNENPKIEIIIQISKQKIDEKSFLRMEFIDNGVGIPDVMKEKIFEGVIQKERKIKGMGLGLLLITKILNIFDGKIYIEDRVKGDYTKGSNFIIYLPEAE